MTDQTEKHLEGVEPAARQEPEKGLEEKPAETKKREATYLLDVQANLDVITEALKPQQRWHAFLLCQPVLLRQIFAKSLPVASVFCLFCQIQLASFEVRQSVFPNLLTVASMLLLLRLCQYQQEVTTKKELAPASERFRQGSSTD